MSQMALASEVGRHINTIRGWESNPDADEEKPTPEPSASDLASIAVATGHDLAFFYAPDCDDVRHENTPAA